MVPGGGGEKRCPQKNQVGVNPSECARERNEGKVEKTLPERANAKTRVGTQGLRVKESLVGRDRKETQGGIRQDSFSQRKKQGRMSLGDRKCNTALSGIKLGKKKGKERYHDQRCI